MSARPQIEGEECSCELWESEATPRFESLADWCLCQGGGEVAHHHHPRFESLADWCHCQGGGEVTDHHHPRLHHDNGVCPEPGTI